MTYREPDDRFFESYNWCRSCDKAFPKNIVLCNKCGNMLRRSKKRGGRHAGPRLRDGQFKKAIK